MFVATQKLNCKANCKTFISHNVVIILIIKRGINKKIILYKNNLGHNVHCNGHNGLYEMCASFCWHLPYHDLQQIDQK